MHRKSIDEQNEQSYRETIQRNVSIIHGQNRKYDKRVSKRVSSLAKTFRDEPLIEMSYESDYAQTYMGYTGYGKSSSRRTNHRNTSSQRSSSSQKNKQVSSAAAHSTKPNLNYSSSPLPPIQIKPNLNSTDASGTKAKDSEPELGMFSNHKTSNDSDLDMPRMRMSVIPVDPNLLAKKITPVDNTHTFNEKEEDQTEAASTV